MFIRKLPSPSISTTSLIGMGRLRAHRRRQPEAHRSQARTGKPRARVHEFVELGGPHLMLADADGDNRFFAAGEPRKLGDRVLLQNAVELDSS